MQNEIRMNEWREFLKEVSTEQQEWKTKVEILSNELGDQVLTEGLPLNGISIDSRGDLRTSQIVISVGEASGAHQTHTIKNPTAIAFLPDKRKQRVVLDIEDEEGTKTLITLVHPMPETTGYFSQFDMMRTSVMRREFPSTLWPPRGIL